MYDPVLPIVVDIDGSRDLSQAVFDGLPGRKQRIPVGSEEARLDQAGLDTSEKHSLGPKAQLGKLLERVAAEPVHHQPGI